MAAGTLSVTNNSKAVVGVGTTFTAFKAGDFLTLVVGQVPYTVAIASVESDTALTLVLPFDGPTATGLAWDGVKRDTMSLATMGVTVQAQKALRLMIADENNWRAIFGDAEEITVTLPNGQVMQGMSWGYLSQLMKQIDPVEMRNLQQQAAASEAAAQGFRDQAEELAQSINPDNLLTKSGNLAGLTDKTQAWLNVRPDGATPLAGNPVGDYDAATKRWVENLINTGTVGPTMNGVMNYGVGQVTLWHSRAFIPSYAVVADGQLLSRTAYPELWAHAQMHNPINDSVWLTGSGNRAKFSTGDGSTTFRVPDLNGVQAGSPANLFGRGSNGSSNLLPGTTLESALPDIAGESPATLIRYVDAASEAFQATEVSTYGYGSDTNNAPIKWKQLSFRASRSSPVYGRYNTTEVVPNSFVGVWIIRASGGFVAANTSWSVINGDASRPADGTTADGGNVCSLYKVNNVNEAEASFRARAEIGGNYSARISVTNSTTQRSANLDFDETGTLTIPNTIVVNSPRSDFVGILRLTRAATTNIGFQPTYADGSVVPDTKVGGHIFFEASTEDSGNMGRMSLWRRRKDGNRTGEVGIAFPATAGTLALQGTSGREYKKDIADADASEAMGRINSQRLVNFVYKDDEQERVRFGVIAEEAELIAPQYIKHNQVSYEDILDEEGNKIGEKTRDRPSVDVNPIVMDLMGCVQYLNKQVEELKAEIAALKK
ncbi:lateral tail fiber protein [Escherichia phage PaulFeyerabend]|uniref:Lateral tail fiber protein n=1 Tax=Escherichia phage PaulFeyerabend TaxID=2851979 RepID=A0AAE7VX21_9CAUD|nr:lateral tail fiber protein [Escherichia phage PaulFeyerabend]QXV83331.1 lateral tail fiber protein [Escherichia phage PaulFeyerabend]